MDEKKNEGQTNQEKKEENSYEFLKETIKAKPWNRKKLAKQVGKLLASGAVFGLAAAVVFSVAAPAMTGKILEKRMPARLRFPRKKTRRKRKRKRGKPMRRMRNCRKVRAEGTPLLLWHRT